MTNGRGYTTIYRYDNNNNLTRIERPAPGGQTQVTQFTYNELNRKVTQTDPNGNTSRYQYDAGGRLIETTDPENNKVSYTYDAHGNLLSQTDGSGITIFFNYDTLHRKIHEYDELDNHKYWQYDKLGHLKQYTDATGSITRYVYDKLGRLTSVIDDGNASTEYKYDAVGNLTQVKDANNKTIIKKFYDKVNRIIRQEDGLGYSYQYGYDGVGNQNWVKDANNRVTNKVYDEENRLIEIHYPDSGQVTFDYDENGNLTTTVNPAGSTVLTFDELDRLISSTDSFGKQVQYGYDIANNRTSITYPADSYNPARAVSYKYDKANRLDTINDWAGRTWDYSTDGAGRITQVVYPNGVKEVRTYDDAGRLSSLAYRKSDDTTLLSYTYTRDKEGNPTEVDEVGTLEPVVNLPLRENYSYDNDNRLISTDRPATYGYDKNGNLTSKEAGGVTSNFAYDFENRFVSQTTGGTTVQHVYDGQGNRIARNDNGSVTRYILDRGRSMSHVLCETNGSGNIIAYYIHGPQIVGRIGADGSQRYYHTDQIGSVVALTDFSETVTDRYAYTPFGVPAGTEGVSDNPFTYVGGLGVMAESDGLYFMRARFYDPENGRFTSKDPIGGVISEPLSYNVYLYASDRPNVLIDPTGLIDETQRNFIENLAKLYASATGITKPEDYYIAQHNLSTLGKANVVKRMLNFAIAAKNGESGTALWNLVAIGQLSNPAIATAELANLAPKFFGGPHTTIEAWLGPEASKLKFDFAYGPRTYFWNAAYSAYWLSQHEKDTIAAYRQNGWWWAQPTVWGYDLRNYLISLDPDYSSTLLKTCNKNAKGQ